MSCPGRGQRIQDRTTTLHFYYGYLYGTHPQIRISKTRASHGLLKSQSFLIAWREGSVPRIKWYAEGLLSIHFIDSAVRLCDIDSLILNSWACSHGLFSGPKSLDQVDNNWGHR
jgi:hypothetical protein